MTAAEWAQRLEHDAIWAQAGREDNGLRFWPDIDEINALTVAEARELAALLRRAERVEAAARVLLCDIDCDDVYIARKVLREALEG